MSAELVFEEPEAAPEEFPELLAVDELVLELLAELELLDELAGLDVTLLAAELFEFDVKESELSCSVPLLAQPVTVHARSAQAAAEMISFFIFYSLSCTNVIGDPVLRFRNIYILH